MPAPHPIELRKRAFSLHVSGMSDTEIASTIGISLGGVSGWLNGKRVRNGKPHRIKLANGNHICSICKEEKHPDLFPPPKFNGKKLSEYSFCLECRKKKDNYQRRGSLEKYLQTRYWELRGRASKQNIPFSITARCLIALFEAQDGKCFYTDERMVIPGVREWQQIRQAISVDRVVPKTGYVSGNIVLCTYKANAVKQNLTVEEMYRWLPGWYWRLVDAGIVEGDGRCRSVTF